MTKVIVAGAGGRMGQKVSQMVLQQDAGAAEINQRGLRCIAHEAGTLTAEEYEVFAFQNWVREQLNRR